MGRRLDFSRYVRSTRSPKKDNCLSGVVQVIDSNGKGYSYVTFTPELVNKLNKRLPFGLGRALPGYLKVIQKRGVYELWLSYLTINNSFFLDTLGTDMPEWVGKVYRKAV